jgi:hypothetical protein
VSITYISVIETTVGILAVSIPTYKPLYKHLLDSSNRYFRKGYDTSGVNGQAQRGELSRKETILSALREGPTIPHINVTHEIELARHTRMGGNWVRVLEDDEWQPYEAGQNSRRDGSHGI